MTFYRINKALLILLIFSPSAIFAHGQGVFIGIALSLFLFFGNLLAFLAILNKQISALQPFEVFFAAFIFELSMTALILLILSFGKGDIQDHSFNFLTVTWLSALVPNGVILRLITSKRVKKIGANRS